MDRIKHISPPDMAAYQAARERWNGIAKPLGSFGMLEEMVQKTAAVQGTPDVDISVRTAVVMCGDHGVVCEGVTQCGQEVTAECAEAIAAGRSNINAVAAQFKIGVVAVDVGIARDVECDGLIRRKAVYGTGNIAAGNAMTAAETEKALIAGLDTVRDLKKSGTKLIISGEMGIGNTTSAAAIASVLCGLPPEKVTGRGAGLTAEGLRKKTDAVRRAVEVNAPSPDEPIEAVLEPLEQPLTENATPTAEPDLTSHFRALIDSATEFTYPLDALRGIPLKKSVAGAIRKNCSEPGRDADPAGMVRERLLARLAESEKGGSWTNSAGWILSWFFLAVGVIVLLEPESSEPLMPVWRAAVWAGCILFLILYRFLRRELSRYGSLLLAMAAVLLLSLIAGVIISFVSPGNPFYNRTVDAGAVSAVEALFTAFCALTGAVWRRIRRLTGRKK